MAAIYLPPVFNLVCSTFTLSNGGATIILREEDIPCQLYNPWRRSIGGQIPTKTTNEFVDAFAALILRLPAGTDIRCKWQAGTGLPDQVEVPQGSGVFYLVSDVADVAKGFPNEYRSALISVWRPTPVPLP